MVTVFKQFSKVWRRLAFTLSIVTLGIAPSLSPLSFVRAEGRDKPPAASASDGKQTIKEYTRIHPKTGLPVRVRSYLRRVVESKAVAVRSYFRHGKHVRGHERRQPRHHDPKGENASEKGKAPPCREEAIV